MGGFMPPNAPKPGGLMNQVRRRITKKRLPGRTNPDQGGLAPQRPPMPGPVMRGPMPPMPMPPTGGIDPAPMPPMPPTGGIDRLPPAPPPQPQMGGLGGFSKYPAPVPGGPYGGAMGGLGARRPLNQDAGNVFGRGIFGGFGG